MLWNTNQKIIIILKSTSWGLWEQEVGQCVCVAELNDSSRAELQLNEHQAAHSSEQRSSGQVWQVSSEDGWLKIRPICAIRWWHWQVPLALSLTSLSLFFFFFFHFLFVSFWSRDKPLQQISATRLNPAWTQQRLGREARFYGRCRAERFFSSVQWHFWLEETN